MTLQPGNARIPKRLGKKTSERLSADQSDLDPAGPDDTNTGLLPCAMRSRCDGEFAYPMTLGQSIADIVQGLSRKRALA